MLTLSHPPHELIHLRETIQEALQLLKEIEENGQKPSLGKLERIMEELIILKRKRLISNPRFETMYSSLIERIDEYRHLVTCSLCVSVYGNL